MVLRKLSQTVRVFLAILLAVLSTGLLQAVPVYADNSKPVYDVPTNGMITICHRTNSVTNPYTQETISVEGADGLSDNDGHGANADHFSEHQGLVFDVTADPDVAYPTPRSGDQWGDIIPPVIPNSTVPGSNTSGLNWNDAGKAIYYNGCNIPEPTPKDATAGVTVSEPTCDRNGVASVTGLANATLSGELDQSVGTHTATFTATAGHLFADGTTSLTAPYTIAAQLTGDQCGTPTEPTEIPTPAGIADICGQANDTVPMPQQGDHYTVKTDSGWVKVDSSTYTRTITYKADAGYVFTASGGWTLSADRTEATYTFTDWGTRCPQTIGACTEITGPSIITTKAQFADSNDDRSAGNFEFTKNGLHIWTDDNSSNAKVAWYHNVDYPLADVGAPSMEYTANSGIDPSMQLVVDFDGDGTADGILVGESVYGNDWWLTNSAAQFVKDGAPSHSGGFGSTNHGTLDQWLTNFPDAQVKAVGFSLGSGVKADGVLASLTIGCHKWIFQAPVATPAAPEFVEPFCDAPSGKVIIPSAAGVVYSINGTQKAAGTYTYTAGAAVVVTATPESGYVFDGTYGPYLHTFGIAPTNCVLGDTDVCPNIPGSQATVPVNMTKNDQGNCVTTGGQGGGHVLAEAASTELPAAIPATGGTSTGNPFLILAASVIAYGAVYFMQGRRQVAQNGER